MFRTTNRQGTIGEMPSKRDTLSVNRNKQRQSLASAMKPASSTQFRRCVTLRDGAVDAAEAARRNSSPRARLASEPARPCSFPARACSVHQAGLGASEVGTAQRTGQGPSAIHRSPRLASLKRSKRKKIGCAPSPRGNDVSHGAAPVREARTRLPNGLSQRAKSSAGLRTERPWRQRSLRTVAGKAGNS